MSGEVTFSPREEVPIAFGTNFAHFSDGPGELSEWEIDDPNARIDRSDHRLSFKDSGSSSHC
jgi:hypothetical protein